MNDDADFGSYTCIASNTLGEGAQIKFNVQEVGGPAVGASTDEGLSTVTIILIAIIVIILLIIIVLLIIFCCLQGACGRAKEKGKVAPTPPPRSVPMYGGGHFGPTIAPHSNGTIKVDEEAGFTPKEEMLATGLIISVPEKAGGRAHHLPPLDTHKDVENYYREERRRSRKKKYRRTQEDRNVLTEPNGDVQ
ncbi:uncharacterized protein LOC106013020 [Aplysia californica]|uniref:Uncharacterized protein LOC106013020 n=1 Tax=Aplysia californica TaxID=6500 RepID=A0ABM1A8X2_APLCA|nr:uncharacterized protein LOC106013020 [Aplysia californica]